MPLKNFLANPDTTNYQLLFRLISPLVDTKEIDSLIDRPEVSWEHLLNMANTYLMTPALWAGLVKKSLDTKIENDLRAYMQELYTLNEDRNQGLKRQACEAIAVLNQIGITPMLIKGAVQLFKPLYENTGTRIMADIDMVVPQSRMNEAIQALMKLGYQKNEIHEPEEQWVDFKTHHHEEPLLRPGDYGAIELHRKALGDDGEAVLSTEALWAAANIYDDQEIRFKMPSLTHSILVEFLHSQMVHGNFQTVRIDYKGLYDVVTIINDRSKDIAWDEIQNRIAGYYLKAVFQTYLWTAHRLFHLPMPNGIRPHATSKAYYALCLATIRWQLIDRGIDSFYYRWNRLKRRYKLLK